MKRLLRVLAKLTMGLLVAVLLLFAVAWWKSEQAVARTYAPERIEIAAAEGPEAIARGEHLVRSRGCTGCHGEDLAGRHVVDAGPVMQIHAPNITVGGTLANSDLVRFEHAVRHAVDGAGRSLMLMPSDDYALLSNEDLAAMFAYLQQLPPASATQPDSRLGPIGRVLVMLGELPIFTAEEIDHARASRPAATPPAAVDAAFGAHVAQVCVGCHRADFSGGPLPGMPPDFKPAANLTAHAQGLANWSEADFLTAMRSGRRPDGSQVNEFMPWPVFGKMDDTELRAIWVYLRSLPPQPTGS
jgi:mono/diheme cytochrome c family protein